MVKDTRPVAPDVSDSAEFEIQESIFEAIAEERERQDKMWGAGFDDKNTPNDWVSYITHFVSSAAYDGNGGQYTLEKFKEGILKAAALCIACLEACERNEGMPPRHYDRQN